MTTQGGRRRPLGYGGHGRLSPQCLQGGFLLCVLPVVVPSREGVSNHCPPDARVDYSPFPFFPKILLMYF